MKHINVEMIDKQSGFDMHDLLREGRSQTLDPIKVSAVINKLVEGYNALLDDYLILKELTLKMRYRRKPGPKGNKKIKRV